MTKENGVKNFTALTKQVLRLHKNRKDHHGVNELYSQTNETRSFLSGWDYLSPNSRKVERDFKACALILVKFQDPLNLCDQ